VRIQLSVKTKKPPNGVKAHLDILFEIVKFTCEFFNLVAITERAKECCGRNFSVILPLD
jgi:hypothetical protein